MGGGAGVREVAVVMVVRMEVMLILLLLLLRRLGREDGGVWDQNRNRWVGYVERGGWRKRWNRRDSSLGGEVCWVEAR